MKLKFFIFSALFLAPSLSFAYTITPTGGDCKRFGTWNNTTKTCTLTTDFSDMIEIASDGITVDGANHTLTGSIATSTGIISYGQNITIKNLILRGFNTGMELSIESSLIENNTIVTTGKPNSMGISLGGNKMSFSVFRNNAIKGGGMAGIVGSDADYDTFIGNTVIGFKTGVDLEYCAGDTLLPKILFKTTLLPYFFPGQVVLLSVTTS